MGKSQQEEAKAVECGYWHLWRYNPALEEEGKNPFTLDSKAPDWDKFEDFLKGEVRYSSVVKQYPERGCRALRCRQGKRTVALQQLSPPCPAAVGR